MSARTRYRDFTPEQKERIREANRRYRAAHRSTRPVGRPMKERCICPNCGNTHIKKDN